MTVDEYWAAVRRLGFTRTNATTVYFHPGVKDYFNIDDPTDITPAQRARTIERLKASLGVSLH